MTTQTQTPLEIACPHCLVGPGEFCEQQWPDGSLHPTTGWHLQREGRWVVQTAMRRETAKL